MGTFPKVVSVCLIVSAFGPYLTNSVRLEHLVLYPAALLAFLTLPLRAQRTLPAPAVTLIALFAALLLAAAISTFLGQGAALLRIASQADNWLQPIAVALIAIPAGRYLVRGLPVLVVLLALNAVIQVYQSILEDVSLMGAWLTEDEQGTSTATYSAQMGRYMGVFNQPFEAGVAYSTGLIAWVYLRASGHTASLRRWFWWSMPLLVVGGALSVSKAFLLIGLPCSIGLLAWERLRSTRRSRWGEVVRATIPSLGFVAGGAVLLAHWSGADYLLRLFVPSGQDDSLIGLYSAGRFGGETVVQENFAAIMATAPLTGLGFQSVEVVDNALLDAFAQAGIVGLVLFGLVLILMLRAAYVLPDSPERRAALVFSGFCLLACLGAPALTVNRAAILLWVTFFALVSSRSKPEAAQRVEEPARQDRRVLAL